MPITFFNPYAHPIGVTTGVHIPCHVVVTGGGIAAYPLGHPPFLVGRTEPVLVEHKKPVVSVAIPHHKSVVTGASSLPTTSTLRAALADAEKPINKLTAYYNALRAISDEVERAIEMKKKGHEDSSFMGKKLEEIAKIKKDYKSISSTVFSSKVETDEFQVLKDQFKKLWNSFLALHAKYESL